MTPTLSTLETDDTALHVGVRQASDGEPVPVTVTSSTDGATWQLALAPDDVALGSVSVGADGTGTTLVTIPAGTPPGVTEIRATSGGEELTASVSVAGPADAAPRAAAEPSTSVTPGVVGGALVVLAAVLLAVAVVVLTRRRRRVRT